MPPPLVPALLLLMILLVIVAPQSPVFWIPPVFWLEMLLEIVLRVMIMQTPLIPPPMPNGPLARLPLTVTSTSNGGSGIPPASIPPPNPLEELLLITLLSIARLVEKLASIPPPLPPKNGVLFRVTVESSRVNLGSWNTRLALAKPPP